MSTKRTWEDFLVTFSKANKFVFANTSLMQQAAESMWNDLRGRPTELDLFIKEVAYFGLPSECMFGI